MAHFQIQQARYEEHYNYTSELVSIDNLFDNAQPFPSLLQYQI